MTMILDGKKIATQIRQEILESVKTMQEQYHTVPGLAVVLVGENPASMTYVASKGKACHEVGMYTEEHRLPDIVSQEELIELIESLNQDSKIHGILVQLPLPSHIDEVAVCNTIRPEKDVDGFHPVNMGKLLSGTPHFVPCTPLGVQALLVRNGISIEGSHVVIVGRSNIVGRPLGILLSMKAKDANATVTICHSRTKDLTLHTRSAQILVAAIGVPHFIKEEMLSPGAVVVDVGMNRIKDPSKKSGFRLCGDVDYEAIYPKVKAITPVPGGVGPMTVTMLLKNTLQAAGSLLNA